MGKLGGKIALIASSGNVLTRHLRMSVCHLEIRVAQDL
jgi:hypothetical protein